MRTLTLPQSGPREPDASPLEYALLVDEIEADGFFCESYGAAVRDPVSGEEASIRHITINADKALALLDALRRGGVPPIALRDVVEDCLEGL